MIILIVLPDDRLGGAEQFLKMLVTYYLKNNYIIHVFFLKKRIGNGWDDIIEHRNLKINYGKFNSDLLGLMGLSNRLLKLKQNKFNYVFTSHTHITGVVGGLIKIGIIKKLYFVGRESTAIFARFNGVKLLLLKSLYKLGFSCLDLLICQTTEMKKQLDNGMPKLKDVIKIKVIPNPIDLDKINVFENEIIDTSLYGNYIVAAGRLIHLKGFDLLIATIPRLKKENINLVILGEGEEREQLEKLIKSLNLEDKVFLLGNVVNVYPYFKNAIACVVSSRVEGFPNVLLQMMSQNKTVISTTCAGGIKDISGLYTCNVNDVNEITKIINYALNNVSETNEIIFKSYLKSRALPSFIKKMEKYIIHS